MAKSSALVHPLIPKSSTFLAEELELELDEEDEDEDELESESELEDEPELEEDDPDDDELEEERAKADPARRAEVKIRAEVTFIFSKKFVLEDNPETLIAVLYIGQIVISHIWHIATYFTPCEMDLIG